MFVTKIILLIILSLVTQLDFVHSEKITGALKRQSLIYYEPPFESNQERADQITEHYITQKMDNFNHQDKRTFQMVRNLSLVAIGGSPE